MQDAEETELAEPGVAIMAGEEGDVLTISEAAAVSTPNESLEKMLRD